VIVESIRSSPVLFFEENPHDIIDNDKIPVIEEIIPELIFGRHLKQ
jgi:hypothetical protein